MESGAPLQPGAVPSAQQNGATTHSTRVKLSSLKSISVTQNGSLSKYEFQSKTRPTVDILKRSLHFVGVDSDEKL